MLKMDAIKFYKTRTKLAKAAGVDPSAVSQWGDMVPEKNAAKLQIDSNGELVYDPAAYAKHGRAKKKAGLTNETQSVG